MLKELACSNGSKLFNPLQIVNANPTTRKVKVERTKDESEESWNARKAGREQPGVEFWTSNGERFVFNGTVEDFKKALS